MHVAVAIVSYRNPDDVTACLVALAASTHADFEVVICENGDSAAYQAMLAAVPAYLAGGQPVRVVSAPDNPGFAGGVNICIAQSPSADAWWVLNPDTEPRPNAMAALVDRLARGGCDMVGGTLLASTGKVQAYGGLWRTWIARAVSLGFGTSPSVSVDPVEIERVQNYVVGASMMVSHRFVATVGPMREDYFLYCEEVEWCVRGMRLGMKLGFAPDAVVLHHQGTTTGAGGAPASRSRMSVYLSSRNMMLMTRDLFPWRLPVAVAGAVAGAALTYARRGAWRQLGYSISGLLAGLTNERGVPGWMRKPG